MTLQEFFTLLLRRWWIVLLAVALGAGMGLVYESSQPKVLATDGRLLIGPALEAGLDIIESTGSLSRGTLQQTLVEIITGNQVTGAAKAELGAGAAGYDVVAVVIPETNVVKVTVSGPNGETTRALAAAVMDGAEQRFEGLYPVYDIAVVEQPDSTVQTAPNPQFGLVIGALAGAILVSIVLIVGNASATRGAASVGAPAVVGAERRQSRRRETGGFRPDPTGPVAGFAPATEPDRDRTAVDTEPDPLIDDDPEDFGEAEWLRDDRAASSQTGDTRPTRGPDHSTPPVG